MEKVLMAGASAPVAAAERYVVIESEHWLNSRTGATASIYGAVPWTRDADAGDWSVVPAGWTIRDLRTGTVGCGRRPFPTAEAARDWIVQQNNRMRGAHTQAGVVGA
ncbi:hypothetical protein AB7849_19350 [Rhodanobacter sp. 115]|uniref:hypothetical protein n=1 Tax=Rhodanobacter sp. FW021-MT20 TaxID=1162282 RepID=UPI0034E4A41E